MEQKTDKKKIGRPATGQIPMRNFRMADEEWEAIKSAAEASGETTSAYLRRVALKDAARVLKNRDD
jgi:uncharacterized protein (DUF1778 family)